MNIRAMVRNNFVFGGLCLIALILGFFAKPADRFDCFYSMVAWLWVASVFYFHRCFWKTRDGLVGLILVFGVFMFLARLAIILVWR